MKLLLILTTVLTVLGLLFPPPPLADQAGPLGLSKTTAVLPNEKLGLGRVLGMNEKNHGQIREKSKGLTSGAFGAVREETLRLLMGRKVPQTKEILETLRSDRCQTRKIPTPIDERLLLEGGWDMI